MNLKQLAELLELSQTTVSRALNGYPEVSEATRQKVLAAAEAHGYAPNMRARSLATGRAMAIGHVIPTGSKHEIVNPVFADFVAGAGEVYSARNYDMVLSVVPDAGQEQAYRDLKTKGSVDGIILHGPQAEDWRIPLLTEIGLPFVVHGRSSGAAVPYSWVDMNNTHAFKRATGFLLDLGHRRVALLNGIDTMDFAMRRHLGYDEAHADRGIAVDPALNFAGEMTEAYGYATTRRLLEGPEAPTALICSSFIVALGIRRAIHERGLVLGRDVSVITHDDELSYLRNGTELPQFTATRSSVREHGRLCATMLLDMIERTDPGPHEMLLEADLILGQSTGPKPQVSREIEAS